MKINVATTEDVPELSELLKSLFAQEAEFSPNSALQTKGLAEIVSNPKVGNILVARDGNRILGMANLLYTVSTALGSTVAILEDMVVSSAARGENVGSQILDHAITLAIERGCKRITLLTDADNVRAHRFYERHGFVRSPMIPFRLNLDERELVE